MIAEWFCASHKGDKMMGCEAGQSARGAEVHGRGMPVMTVQATWILGKVAQRLAGRQTSCNSVGENLARAHNRARVHNKARAQNGVRPLQVVAAKNLRREERVVTLS